MNIILMRHGEAVPFAVNDGDRELTPKGKSEASRTGTQLKMGDGSRRRCFAQRVFERNKQRRWCFSHWGLIWNQRSLTESRLKMIGPTRWQ